MTSTAREGAPAPTSAVDPKAMGQSFPYEIVVDHQHPFSDPITKPSRSLEKSHERTPGAAALKDFKSLRKQADLEKVAIF